MFVLSGKLYTVAEGFLSLSIQQVNACRTAGGGWMKRTLPCCTSTWNSRYVVAKEENQLSELSGVVPCLLDGGLSIL